MQNSFLALLVYVVFHAPISTWLISIFGAEPFFKGAKDGAIALLTALAVYVAVQHRGWSWLGSSRINLTMAGYLLVSLLATVANQNEFDAAIVGLVFNFRFLAIFFIGRVIMDQLSRSEKEKFKNRVLKYLTAAITVVIIFGSLQVTVLPDDFLSNIGYGEETIEPFGTVDENPDYVRILSTLRGPVPLGIFMILGTTLLAVYYLASKNRFKLNSHSLILVLSLFVVYFTYSRAAWLGLAVSLFLVALWKFGRPVIYGSLSLLAAGLLVVILFRDTQFISYNVFHNEPEAVNQESSDSYRLNAYGGAIENVIEEPLGAGLGSAGPASFYAESPNISENYYLQVAQEAGFVGLGLFVYILYLAAKSLVNKLNNNFELVLITSLIGISLASLLLHTWTDETIAVTWWGLLGLVYRE